MIFLPNLCARKITTDASTTGLGIKLWQKQDDGITKLVASGSRYLKETGEKFNWRIGITGSGVGVKKFRFYLYGKKVYFYANHLKH